jgi:hypothetical protein
MDLHPLQKTANQLLMNSQPSMWVLSAKIWASLDTPRRGEGKLLACTAFNHSKAERNSVKSNWLASGRLTR